MDESTVQDLAKLNGIGLEPTRRRYLAAKLLRADKDGRTQILADAMEELLRNRSRYQADYLRTFKAQQEYGERHPKK